jgi:hypothetical protein
MKRIMILIGIVLMVGILYSTKKVPLDLDGRAAWIQVDDTQFYIAEGAFIHIYSLKDYRFQKKFGGRGEGPGEFKTMISQNLGSVLLDIYQEYIIINSIGKISFFTKQGKMIKEIPTSFNGRFLPLNGGFVGYGVVLAKDRDVNVTINIYDSKLRLKKEIHKETSWMSGSADGLRKEYDMFYITSSIFHVADSKIFLDNDKQDIVVFDKDGNKLYFFSPNVEPLKFTEKDKQEFKNSLKMQPVTRALYELLKNRLRFPDFFPKIRFFYVDNQKIYVLSWKKKDNESELYIYDLKGNPIKKTYVSLVEQDIMLPYPTVIRNEKLYQVVENEDTDEWELQVSEIK